MDKVQPLLDLPHQKLLFAVPPLFIYVPMFVITQISVKLIKLLSISDLRKHGHLKEEAEEELLQSNLNRASRSRKAKTTRLTELPDRGIKARTLEIESTGFA